MPEVLDPTVTSSHLPNSSFPLHSSACIHLPCFHPYILPSRRFFSQCLSNNCPHPQRAKNKRKPGYHTENQSPSSLSLYSWCPSPKKSLLSVEALTGALFYVHAKIFFLKFAPTSSEQPLHVSSKVLVIYHPLQAALSTTVRKSTVMYFAVTNSEESWCELPGRTQHSTAKVKPTVHCFFAPTWLTHLPPMRVTEISMDLHRLLLKDILSILHFVTNVVIQIHMKTKAALNPPFFF